MDKEQSQTHKVILSPYSQFLGEKKSLGILTNDQDFTDVTLVTMDKDQIQTHKVIFSPYSQFLETLSLGILTTILSYI